MLVYHVSHASNDAPRENPLKPVPPDGQHHRVARSCKTPSGSGVDLCLDGVNVTGRDHCRFADIAFQGLELVPPGLLVVSEWRPESGEGLPPHAWEVSVNGAVARKP
jgi:hypothetical protein